VFPGGSRRTESGFSPGPFPDIGILIDLVRQTAHQPTTETRDLGWIEAEILPFGHPDRDRVKPIHEGGATQAPATRAKAATDPSTVADSERPHLDPAPIPARKLAQQRTEIEPSLGGEIDHRLAPGQRQSSLDRPHIETELAGATTEIRFDLALDVVGVFAALLIFPRCESDHPTHGTLFLSKDRQSEEAHPPEKLSIRRFDEIAGVVPNLEGARATRHRREIRINDHRDKILDPWYDRNLGN